MDEKRVVSKYLEYRENVLKYTNIDMNLELENDEQVLKRMQLVDDYSYYESSNVRAYLKTRRGVYFQELTNKSREERFLNMLMENVFITISKKMRDQLS